MNKYYHLLLAPFLLVIPILNAIPVVAAACDVNQAPRAVIGPERNVSLGEIVNFDGSKSSDPDGDALNYSWDFDSSNGIATDQTGVRATYHWLTAGTFTVTLTVRDACTSSSASTRVNVSNQLTVTIKPTVTQVSPGDTFGYTVQYANFTRRTIEDMQLTLDYDERYLGVTDPAGGNIAAGSVLYRQPFLYQSSSELRTFWFKVHESLPVGTVSIPARVKLAGRETTTVESGEVTVSVYSQVDLLGSIIIDEPTLRPGQTTRVVVGYRNRGNAVANNVSLNLHYDPQALEPIQVNSGDTSQRGTIEWLVGQLGPDQKSTLEVRMRVREGAAAGKLDTWISLNAANASPYEQHMLTEVGGTPLFTSQGLTASFTATDTDEFRVVQHRAQRGDYVTFTIIITNPLADEVQNVLVHLDYPDETFEISELRDAVDAGGALSWEIDRIEPKGSRTRTVRLRIKPQAPLNTSTISEATISGTGIALRRLNVSTLTGTKNGSTATVSAAATAPRTGGSSLPIILSFSAAMGILTFVTYRRSVS